MNISINIDNELFDSGGVGEAIKTAFETMPDEEKATVMKDILRQYLLDDKFIKNYFIRKSTGYGYQPEEYPTQHFQDMIEKIDFSAEMNEVKEAFMKVIKNDLGNMLLKLMLDSYINTVANTLFQKSSDFKTELKGALEQNFYQTINYIDNNKT